MSWIAIVTTSGEHALLAPLRDLLPDVPIGELRRRLAGAGPLVVRELWRNDHEETHALLRAVVSLLQRHGTALAIHELERPEEPASDANAIEPDLLESIMSEFERRLDHDHPR